MTHKSESVASIILSPDQKHILLIKRRDTPIWALPGGGIDEGEKPEIAAEREALEETGVQITVQRLVGRYYPTNRLGRVTFVYLCTPNSDTPRPSTETIDAKYFPLDNLPKPFFFIHKKWVDDALEHHPQPLEKPIEGVNYWNLLKYLICHPLLTLRFLLSRVGLPWNSR